MTAALSVTTLRASAADAVRVTVDGRSVVLAHAPIVRAGRLFVPLRGIFEEVGASVVFSSGQMTATGNGHTVSLNLGYRLAFVDGQREMLDAAPFLERGSLYVPLRFVSQALGTLVEYDPRNNTVAISTGNPQTPKPSVAMSPLATAPPSVTAFAPSPTPSATTAQAVASAATAPATATPRPTPSPSPLRVAVAATAPPTGTATPRATPSPSPQRAVAAATALPTAAPRPTPSPSPLRAVVAATAPPTPTATPHATPSPIPQRATAAAMSAPSPRPTPHPSANRVASGMAATTPPPRPAVPRRPNPPPRNVRRAASSVHVVREGPANGTSVRSNRPIVHASFLGGTVNPNRVRISLDGRDVTVPAYVSANRITYTPLSPIPTGPHEVRVRGVDQSGAPFARVWRFRSGSEAPVVTLATVAPRPGGTVGRKFTVRGRTRPGATVSIQVNQTSRGRGVGQFLGGMLGLVRPARTQRTVTADRTGRFVSQIAINAPRGVTLGIVIISTDPTYGIVATPLRFSVRMQ